jgi:hypothetical protein
MRIWALASLQRGVLVPVCCGIVKTGDRIERNRLKNLKQEGWTERERERERERESALRSMQAPGVFILFFFPTRVTNYYPSQSPSQVVMVIFQRKLFRIGQFHELQLLNSALLLICALK